MSPLEICKSSTGGWPGPGVTFQPEARVCRRKATVATASARSRENPRLRARTGSSKLFVLFLNPHRSPACWRGGRRGGGESLSRTRTPSRTVGGRVPRNPLRAGLEARYRARVRALLGRRTRRRSGERGRAGADGVGVRRPSALPWWSGTGRGPPSGWR